jgi:hypothetical protein
MPEVRRKPYPFEDQDAYLHAVSLIPLSDSPSREPFVVDERGMDQSATMFAVDHSGLRFFLSELNPDRFSVSKNGLLLLNKAESLRLRCVHEQIVNRLRLGGIVLAAEFGTAVLGKKDLLRRADFRLRALLEFVLKLGKTTTWRVTASVLDDRVQQRMGTDPASQRSSRSSAERGRHVAPAKRIDVKALERLLTREKKIAESMLDALSPLAEEHMIELMVNLGSGRSEDWKPILKAAFTLPSGMQQRFFQAVLEVEADHANVEPLVRVTGTTESFSLLM